MVYQRSLTTVNGLARVLPFVTPYRRLLILSSLFAILVAMLWGANMSVAFPLVNLLTKHQNLQTYIGAQISIDVKNCSDLEQQLQRVEEKLTKGQVEGKQRRTKEELKDLAKQTSLQGKLSIATRRLLFYRWIQARILPYMPADQFNTFALILGLLLVATVLKAICMFIQEVLVGRAVQLVTMDVRKACFRHSLHLDYQTLTKQGTSDLMALFTHDIDTMANGLTLLAGKVIREPLKALACILLAFYINWRLTALSLVFVPLAMAVFHRFGKSLKKASHRSMESMSRIYKVLEETFDSIKVVLAFNGGRRHRLRFHDENKTYFKKSMKIVTVEAMTNPTTEVMGMAAVLISMLPGAYLVLRHRDQIWGIALATRPMEIDELVVLYALLAGILDPVRKLSSVYGKLKKSSAAAERVFEFMDRQTLVKDPGIPEELPRHSESIEFKNVCFQYRSAQEQGRGRSLDGVDLLVKAGEVIAVVGDNGSGKSTLVNLLPRYYDPDAGAVLIDGIDLRHARIRDVRSQLGVVTQETLLFDESILENIRYGRPDATREEIEEAARQAHASSFIEQLPGGYETCVGEKGMRLSGGQRQRISLARAILRNPAILILDEATSAIDSQSELLIHKALQSFIRGRTAFIITHSVTNSVLDLVTRIAVMEHGRLIGLGTHEELLHTCPAYQKLHHVRARQQAA
jgi:subfamily B ATP-binding cassette protein MsbA